MENLLPERSIDLRPFGGLLFDEKTHTYINDKNEIYTGMSTFCKKFSKPFDAQNTAKYKAIKNILKEKDFNNLKTKLGGWQNVHKIYDTILIKKPDLGILLEKEKNSIINGWDSNTNEGSLEHDKRERFIIEKGFEYQGVFYPYLPKNITQISKEDFGVVTELMTWDHSMKLCGLVDLVIFDKGIVHVLDYKTNKEITTVGFKNERLQAPFDKFQDCSLSKYSIQLRGYLEMIIRLTKLQKGNCEIIWTKSEKYKRKEDKYIPTINLDNELLKAFKNYERTIK